MKPNDYAKLEKDYSFKKNYLNSTLWWKNILMIPPVCLLFVGLVGILYLFNLDKLVSWYIIPYLLLFVVGTILLKAMKKHIQKTAINRPDSFLICLAKPIGEKDGYTYTAFVKDSHRHNKHYIANEIKDISTDDILNNHNAPFRKKTVLIHNDESGSDLCIRAYTNRDLNRRSSTWREDGLIPVLYIDDKYTFIIKKKDLIITG